MTPKQALDILSAKVWQPLNGTQPAFDSLRDVLRRDWAVRVLDAWASDKFGAQHWLRREVGFICTLHWPDAKLFHEFKLYDTEDSARLAAARAVYAELPADARSELGEQP